jgi:type I restriction enzyme S subunit
VLVGTVRPKQKSHGFVSAEHDGKICSSGFGVLRTGANLNSRYLNQEILSNRFFCQMEAYVAGSGYPAVKISDLKKHRVSVPPLSEQRKIATVLYAVDRTIQKNQQIYEKAREVEEASKTKFFTRGYSRWELDESVGWRCRANKFPKDWKVKPAEELMNITRGASPRPRSDDSLFGGEIPWIKIGDAERGISKSIKNVDSYVTEKGKQKSKFVKKGTLLVANSGATCGFSVFAGVDGCVHDGWLILREHDGLVSDFLYHYINWNYNYLQSLSLGSAQTNLSTGLFGRLDIPLPPIQEQRQIVEALDSINQVATHASKEVERLKRLKRGLMQDLLSGTVRTTDTNIEIPEEIAKHG